MSLRTLLKVCLTFVDCQPFVAYKCVAYKKKCVIRLLDNRWSVDQDHTNFVVLAVHR